MLKKTEAETYRSFITKLQKELGEQVLVFEDEELLLSAWATRFSGRVLEGTIFMNENGLLHPIILKKVESNFNSVENSVKPTLEKLQEELNDGYYRTFSNWKQTAQDSILLCAKRLTNAIRTTSTENVNNKVLSQFVDDIIKLFNVAPNSLHLLIYINGDILKMAFTTESTKGYKEFDLNTYNYVERMKRSELALELIEVEDKIYEYSKKRKQLKEELNRENYRYWR